MHEMGKPSMNARSTKGPYEVNNASQQDIQYSYLFLPLYLAAQGQARCRQGFEYCELQEGQRHDYVKVILDPGRSVGFIQVQWSQAIASIGVLQVGVKTIGVGMQLQFQSCSNWY